MCYIFTNRDDKKKVSIFISKGWPRPGLSWSKFSNREKFWSAHCNPSFIFAQRTCLDEVSSPLKPSAASRACILEVLTTYYTLHYTKRYARNMSYNGNVGFYDKNMFNPDTYRKKTRSSISVRSSLRPCNSRHGLTTSTWQKKTKKQNKKCRRSQ